MAQQVAPNLDEHRRRRSAAVRLDLAAGVNRYGPPGAVLDALRSLSPDDLAAPPVDAAARLEAAYAAVLGVEPGELVAGQGAAAFLWNLGRLVPHGAVAVPRPAWGEVLAVFPKRGFARYPGEQLPSIDQVDAALDAAELVIISNPQMPTGITLGPDGLADAARRHPASTLVVDESAIDFLPDPAASTLVGTEADNIVVLRSSSEFHGTAATQTGVAWSRDTYLLRSLFGHREALRLSGLDVLVAEAALAAGDWAADVRRRLAADGDWLDGVLRPLGGRLVPTAERPQLPYRCVFSDNAGEWAAFLADAGIAVRALGAGHGVYPGALGLFAPLEAERTLLAAAIGATPAGSPVLSEAG